MADDAYDQRERRASRGALVLRAAFADKRALMRKLVIGAVVNGKPLATDGRGAQRMPPPPPPTASPPPPPPPEGED